MKLYEKHQTYPVTLILNGVRRSAPAEARMLLSDFLRHALGATGTHVGCEHGICGACTVRVNGVAQRACMQLAVQADGCRVDTVEGLGGGADGELGDLQQAFRRNHALQCGFCTAGILMSCSHFLEQVPSPDEQQVRDMLSGHLCRCTGYTNIVNAVLEVAAQRQAQASALAHPQAQAQSQAQAQAQSQTQSQAQSQTQTQTQTQSQARAQADGRNEHA